MSFYAKTDLSGSNGQKIFTFSFPYIDQEHIHVYKDGVETFDFAFTTDFEITLDAALSGPHTIRIRRITPIDAPLVDYQNGSSLNETDLDSVALQMLYIAQESQDTLVDEILSVDESNHWDALGNRIINVGTPSATTDAATKAYVDSSFSSSGNGHAIGAHVDSVPTSLVKGDILVVADQGSSVYKYDKIAVGSDGQLLMANSAANSGLVWSSAGIDLAVAVQTVYNRANNYLTEINFGTTGVSEASFVVTDANVSTSSIITGTVAYVAPTGKDLDEMEMDPLDLKFAPGAGSFTIYAKGLEGYVEGNVKISYHLG